MIADITRDARANKGLFSVEFSDAFAINAKTKATAIADAMHIHNDRAKLISILFSACFNFIIEKTSEQVFC